MPHTLWLILLLLSAASFAAGGACAAVGLRRVVRPDRQPGWSGRAGPLLEGAGLLLAGAALAGHVVTLAFTGSGGLVGGWVPFADNTESLLWLAVLLGGFVLYVRWRRPVGGRRGAFAGGVGGGGGGVVGLEALAMPLVAAALVSAAVVELWLPREYHLRGAWVVVHRMTSYAGAAAFAVAAVSGVLYLAVSRRLKRKRAPAPAALGSLERLEGWTFAAVTLGFALLSIGLVTGLARLPAVEGDAWRLGPKIALASGVWIIYAIVLHTPILPNMRGRRTAWLSVAGFVLMLGTIIAVQLMTPSRPPGSARAADAPILALAMPDAPGAPALAQHAGPPASSPSRRGEVIS